MPSTTGARWLRLPVPGRELASTRVPPVWSVHSTSCHASTFLNRTRPRVRTGSPVLVANSVMARSSVRCCRSSQVRIGAIFALERIARESLSDRPHIVSTLAALVRERLPTSAAGEGGYVQVLMQRAPDAQAAMTALCRPPLSDDRRVSSEIGGLNLSRTDLRRASLKNADLRGANLWGAHLENADLRGADLTDSNLNNAYFGTISPGQPGFERGTDLRHATLTRAQLKNTHDFSVALTEGVIGLADDERTLAGRQA